MLLWINNKQPAFKNVNRKLFPSYSGLGDKWLNLVYFIYFIFLQPFHLAIYHNYMDPVKLTHRLTGSRTTEKKAYTPN